MLWAALCITANSDCQFYLTTLAYAYSRRVIANWRWLAIRYFGGTAPKYPRRETSILSLPIESGCHGQPTNPSLKAVSTPAKRLRNWLKNHAACPPKAEIRHRD
jgi:hypothetical protein